MRPTRCVRSPRIQAVIPFASRCKEIWGVFLLLVAFAAISPAQTFLVLQNFNGSNGNDPEGSLVQGVDGALYGTTADGGDFNSGTVYKITPSGRLTTLHSFCAQSSCPDGRGIGAPLVVGSDGNLYGTTVSGGANGFGTVFKITPGGALTTIYSFCVQSNCTDGSLPEGGLVQATDGNFYGTTSAGGVSSFGTVFKITRAGGLTTLYSFCPMGFSCTDGDAPAAGLIQGKDGNFYGTTTDGGAHFQGGTVFKITPLGTLTTLYSFCALSNCADGFNPFKAPLVQGTDGNFYGTTSGGGTHSELGTIFKITPTGTLTTLYNFCALNNCTDGINPYFGVIQASDGNFYGTTFSGGSNALNGYGTIFKITPAGALTTLYTFCPQSGCSDSRTPYGGLVQATNGIFYGTACCGGTSDDGTVFSLSVGLGPFVTTQPGSGKVGTAVNIFGSNLTGATAVSFNGTAAAFTVVSNSEIRTSVPNGATTGKIKVTTAHGVLQSNKAFKVIPKILSFLPTSGPVGTSVQITGQSFTGTTAVTFGGARASTVTVNSDGQITADVPAGAATGKIAVTTPGGSAQSATDFTVTP